MAPPDLPDRRTVPRRGLPPRGRIRAAYRRIRGPDRALRMERPERGPRRGVRVGGRTLVRLQVHIDAGRRRRRRALHRPHPRLRDPILRWNGRAHTRVARSDRTAAPLPDFVVGAHPRRRRRRAGRQAAGAGGFARALRGFDGSVHAGTAPEHARRHVGPGLSPNHVGCPHGRMGRLGRRMGRPAAHAGSVGICDRQRHEKRLTPDATNPYGRARRRGPAGSRPGQSSGRRGDNAGAAHSDDRGSVLATVGLGNGQLSGFNDHDLWIGRFTR